MFSGEPSCDPRRFRQLVNLLAHGLEPVGFDSNFNDATKMAVASCDDPCFSFGIELTAMSRK
jgi:hypothetical protein